MKQDDIERRNPTIRGRRWYDLAEKKVSSGIVIVYAVIATIGFAWGGLLGFLVGRWSD